MLETESVEAVKKLMQVSWTTLKTDNGDFSEQNLGNLPSQIVITLFLVGLTSKFESAVQSNSFHQLSEEMDQWLSNLAQRFRDQLTKSQRTVLQALSINILAYRNLAYKMVGHEGSEEERANIWYDHQKFLFTNGVVTIQCGGVTQEYQYRLLDTRPLLIITELSQKVYQRTIKKTGDYMGTEDPRGADSTSWLISYGPARTGKTESFKDILWYMGMSALIYNISDQCTPPMLDAALKCVDGSHSICFDEFNRLTPEVLADLPPIFGAKIKEGHRFFATMNPGYAGRTELPQDLKKIATAVSRMTVPPYTDIVKGMLMQEGSIKFDTLAVKVIQIQTYFKETLPKLAYLDFGLRAVKSWIVCAGALMRSGLDEDFALALSFKNRCIASLPQEYKDQYLSYISLTLMGPSQTKLL